MVSGIGLMGGGINCMGNWLIGLEYLLKEFCTNSFAIIILRGTEEILSGCYYRSGLDGMLDFPAMCTQVT